MKKLILIFTFATLLASCADDDSKAGSKAKPITVIIGGNTPVTFAYDDKDRLQSITQDGTVTTITYNAKNLAERITTGDNYYEFTYNNSGKFLSYKDQAGNVSQMLYISDNQYTINGIPLNLDPDNEVLKYSYASFEYNNLKGAFANVKHLNGFVLAIANSSAMYYGSRKRRNSLSNVGGTSAYTYVEGDNGLPASQTLQGTTTVFQYSE
ncbi:hypothetical protein [Flavobacterium selenitireducens]|uniref:hypothetical protein n=1 Tax=Flavobacterium selenitireducens TaxID=2722704 RepID=UPI00168BA85F|nr:hypothetical protein [Flavobacterium selenitireducens]MBD3582998.1 hypothetical protein [Flavobacterium selenitireducens]